MTKGIREFVSIRGIKYLLHFTRLENLDSIIQNGLVTRDILERAKFSNFNDQYRIDGTTAVCLSIGFPNYKMFYRLRQENSGIQWVVLAIKPNALWELPCAFCSTNAASASMTSVPLEERMGLSSLQGMYSENQGKLRSDLKIPSEFPTDPQAEVLMIKGVPSTYIFGVAVNGEPMKSAILNRYPALQVLSVPQFFSARVDYAHWKQGG